MKLSVIDFMVVYRNPIGAMLCLLLLLTYIIYALQHKLTKTKFEKLCSLFVERFGARPAEVIIYQNGGVFFSFMRDAFFIKALYFKENVFHTRGMDNAQIRFIKALPEQYTYWLRVKVRITIIGVVLLFSMLAIYYIPPLFVG